MRPHAPARGSAGSPAGAQLLAQDELLDLARRRARQLVDRAQLLGPLLPGQAGGRQVGPHRIEIGWPSLPACMRKKAQPCSPSRSSGAATTATSATPSMWASSCSTSAALTFSPPRMMMSFTRSVMVR